MKILSQSDLKNAPGGSDSDATMVFVEPSTDSYLSFKKKKKKKRQISTMEIENSISGTQENESESLLSMNPDSCSKKKKRKNSEILSVIEDSFTSISSTNGIKKDSENVIEDSFVSTSSLNGKKKKRKNSEISQTESSVSVIEDSFKSQSIIIDSDTSPVVKKKKKKRQRNDDSQSNIDSANSFDPQTKEIDSDTIIIKKKEKKKQKNDSENNDNQSTIDSDNSFNKKKKKKRQRNDDSQSTIDSDQSTSVKKKKKKRQRSSDEIIEPSLINIDSDGSFIRKKKHKDSSFDEVEPSLLTIDSSGSFIAKKKHKNSEVLVNQLVSNENESLHDYANEKKKQKSSENVDSDSSIISKKKTNSGANPDSEKIKNESDEPKKIKRTMKSEEIFSGNDSFYNSTPKKPKKRKIKEEQLNSPNGLKQENVEEIESLENKQERLSDTCEVLDELLSHENGDEVKLERFSPSQEFSKENSQVHQESIDREKTTVKDESIDDFQLKLAVSELSKDIDFEIPQLHKILNRASKPNPAQRALIKAKGLKAKQGKFTSDEDRKVIDNWEEIVKMTGIEDRPQLFFCMRNSRIPPLAKQNFLYYLSRNLPDRTPCSVFNRFKLLMANVKKGRFSQEEDDYIKSIISTTTTSNRPVKEMAEHLKRTRLSIEHRILKLLKSHNRKIKWRKNNAAAFIKYLLRGTECSEVEDLRNRPITKLEWNYLSKKLDGVPVRILVRVWKEKLHPALFIRHDQLDLRKVKMKLIEMFKENNETEWKRVNWRRYASKFKGLTVLRVYSLIKQAVTAYVPKEKRGNLKKCIKILSKMPEDNLHKHVLYKMVYQDGAVRELRENTKGNFGH